VAEAERESSSPEGEHDPYLALRYPSFRLLAGGGFIGSFGQQMLTVALGWELYVRTGSALALGFVGLAQVLPLFVLTLPAGHVADRYSRKQIVLLAEIAVTAGSLGLAALSATRGPLPLFYVCLVLLGSAQAFTSPAQSALIANVVPPNAFESATKWRSSTWQLSAVLGPAAGGFLVGTAGATVVFALNAAAGILYALFLLAMRVRPGEARRREPATVSTLLEGIRFLGRTPVLLAAITLDLFAVLLGGAVALLPIYARSILHVGAFGLGWLQASSSVGAVLMALVLAHRPAFRHAGLILLIAVAGFGAATIVFGLSTWFPLSLLMLFTLGALDNISVVIRSTLVLVRTPDQMRGRVGAVNSLFIGTSNQLGGFESGLAAQLFGPVIAVVAGGVGTILVVLAVAALWPQMRNLGSLSE